MSLRPVTVIEGNKEVVVQMDPSCQLYDPAAKRLLAIAKPVRQLLAEMEARIAALEATVAELVKKLP